VTDRHQHEADPPSSEDEQASIPAFDLPAWGTAGAPALPPDPVQDTPATDTSASRHRPVLVTVDAIPGMTRLVGMVAAEGSAGTDDEPAVALGIARRAALDRLSEAASDAGADGVVGVRFSVTVTKRGAAVLASGTAVGRARS
jgi:hypothetical protein